ncbi:hypothetical protein NEIPOLOT_02455 [Neisseria polysaccharea ATCC 43768]|nr:hypothetical protein NEIPOLOT_02455 [Neisseria polysaccharea ATCC 43768]
MLLPVKKAQRCRLKTAARGLWCIICRIAGQGTGQGGGVHRSN